VENQEKLVEKIMDLLYAVVCAVILLVLTYLAKKYALLPRAARKAREIRYGRLATVLGEEADKLLARANHRDPGEMSGTAEQLASSAISESLMQIRNNLLDGPKGKDD
jgi:hypothetical protein